MCATTDFISYSHDTLEHSQRVLQLANALRGQGVDAELDHWRSPGAGRFLADIHLYRARLFGLSKHRPENYPWTSPQHDLAEARGLIEKHGYWRRKEELEDAEAAARAVQDSP